MPLAEVFGKGQDLGVGQGHRGGGTALSAESVHPDFHAREAEAVVDLVHETLNEGGLGGGAGGQVGAVQKREVAFQRGLFG